MHEALKPLGIAELTEKWLPVILPDDLEHFREIAATKVHLSDTDIRQLTKKAFGIPEQDRSVRFGPWMTTSSARLVRGAALKLAEGPTTSYITQHIRILDMDAGVRQPFRIRLRGQAEYQAARSKFF